MTNAGRLKDLADVLELIKILNLPKSLAAGLDPYVRERFLSLWKEAVIRYITVWKKSQLDDPAFSSVLAEMHRDGVVVEHLENSDEVRLVSTDTAISAKYDLNEESEFWPRNNESTSR